MTPGDESDPEPTGAGALSEADGEGDEAEPAAAPLTGPEADPPLRQVPAGLKMLPIAPRHVSRGGDLLSYYLSEVRRYPLLYMVGPHRRNPDRTCRTTQPLSLNITTSPSAAG